MKSILELQQPIIGLSPMDGVTDSAYRFITQKYGNPDIMFTEFTNVMGLCIAGDNLLKDFEYDESERLIIGQIYGKEPEYFYHAAKIVCALGFDGVDINMGCPAKTVSSSGAGAGLIKTPDLAREIIAAVKKGVSDWVENGKLTGLSERTYRAVVEKIKNYQLRIKNENIINSNSIGFLNLSGEERQIIPTSVKTRIGYDIPVTENWIKNLTLADPAWITVHGRTLKQLYTGEANWDEIRKAVESTDLPVLANGDIKSAEDVKKVLDLTKANGVLIGRATYGNPWIFSEIRDQMSGIRNQNLEISFEEKVRVLIEHTEKFVLDNPEPKAFFQMRKHFGWYMKSFDGAKEVREKLMRSNSLEEVKTILNEYTLINL